MKQGGDKNFVCVTTYLPLTLEMGCRNLHSQHLLGEFLRYFIWVFTVCQNTSSGVSSTVKPLYLAGIFIWGFLG